MKHRRMMDTTINSAFSTRKCMLFLLALLVAGCKSDSLLSPPISASSFSLDDNDKDKTGDDTNTVNAISFSGLYPHDSHGIVDALLDAFSDASGAINTAGQQEQEERHKKNAILHQGGKLHKVKRWFKRVVLPLLQERLTATTMMATTSFGGGGGGGGGGGNTDNDFNNNKDHHTRESTSETKENNNSNINKRRKQAFEGFRFINKLDMEETIAGARLLSGSFQILSNTAGFLAKTVRVSGDTAAGLMGSSVKFVGTGVKAVGSGLTVAGNRLLLLEENEDKANMNSSSSSSSKGSFPPPAHEDKNNGNNNPRHYHTNTDSKSNTASTSSSSLSPRTSWRQRQKKRYSNARRRYRQVTAKSVRFVGNIVGGLGDTLLIAGVAAESLTSATAGVAEETVRVFQDLTGTISVAISLRGRDKKRYKYDGDYSESSSLSSTMVTSDLIKKKLVPSYVSFGTYDRATLPLNEEPSSATHIEAPRIRLMTEPSIEDAMEMLDWLISDAVQFGKNVASDVEGVPSLATEIGAALLLCYLLSVLALPRKTKKDTNSTTNRLQRAGECSKEGRHRNPEWFRFTRSQRDNMDDPVSKEERASRSYKQICFRSVWGFFKLMIVLPYRVLRWLFHVVFTLIFNRKMFLLCTYGLVWAYLSRMSQQRAQLVHRRSEAVGFRNGLKSVSGSPHPTETALWLNHILENLWRIKLPRTKNSLGKYNYPVFVTKAFRSEFKEGYGGLEPYISSAIGSGVVNSLELTKALRPTDVAYVSLYSLSLGSRPPIVRTVKLGNDIRRNHSRIELDIDVDAFLEDMSVVLEVKLSSLSYALLPSTKIKIHDLSFRAAIKAVLLLDPGYPFVSKVELSMSKQPHCDIRITPDSKDSGLKGVDLGALPFFNDWIQEAIKTGLAPYISPSYVTLDVAELLLSDEKPDISSFSPINIENLRRKTRHSITSPRTSTPEGIAITSVADKLESRHTSTQVVGPDYSRSGSNTKAKKKTILRPVTELSRLALDRHALKEDNLVRPVTELSKLGMDRWLDSFIRMKYEETTKGLGS